VANPKREPLADQQDPRMARSVQPMARIPKPRIMQRAKRRSIVRFQAFTVTELEKQQGDDAYREFLRRDGMSLGLYRLAAGKTDRQHPHATDEVYLVISGRALLKVEDRSIEVSTGSVVSVDHGADHHFTDITEDLTLLVVFAPPTTPET
jgi:mannose-6-phosphate isomerase-like protein (cupin superfamily)